MPPELLHQGWRKFWSRRENRPYFFNRLTGETLWEMPPHQGFQPQSPGQPPPPQGAFERNSDPLGISGNGPPAQHHPPPGGQHPPPHGGPHPPQMHPPPPPGQHGVKRRPSEEMGGGPNAKRGFIVVGPWDLEIPTNIIIFERKPILLPHPHPDVEVVRFQFVMKLRQSYQEMCHSREGTFFIEICARPRCPI